MASFILKRLLTVIPSLIGLLALAFVMIRVLPADPAVALAGDQATPQMIAQIREAYGFDRPLLEQFWLYLGRVAHFDFGVSIYSQREVALDMVDRLPATLELTFASLLVSVAVGIPLGVIAATHHNRWPDFVIRIGTVAGIGIASFWFAIMLQLLFTMELDWLPLSGRLSNELTPPPFVTGLYLIDALIAFDFEAWTDALRHLAMPTMTLAVAGITTIARFTRAGMLEVLQKDFITYERAAGYPARRVVWIYALRASIGNAVTQIGLLFGALIAGSIIVETIFVWPGIGTYVAQAIFAADYKPMLAVTLLVGLVYALVNIGVDILLAFLDPRVRAQG
ncbi:MAG: ABC transporter permease [Pseudomonadota bacterium]